MLMDIIGLDTSVILKYLHLEGYEVVGLALCTKGPSHRGPSCAVRLGGINIR